MLKKEFTIWLFQMVEEITNIWRGEMWTETEKHWSSTRLNLLEADGEDRPYNRSYGLCD